MLGAKTDFGCAIGHRDEGWSARLNAPRRFAPPMAARTASPPAVMFEEIDDKAVQGIPVTGSSDRACSWASLVATEVHRCVRMRILLRGPVLRPIERCTVAIG